MDEISFEDFCKVEMRFGKVLSAERVPKSDKLIKMQVDFGDFQRQIVAGVGKSVAQEQYLHGTFLFVVNLAPRKLMGLESHGMLLAGGVDAEHLFIPSPVQCWVPTSEPPPGTKVG